MKILVPTDFSETSENAFSASILFAKKLEVEIHLLHCIELPKFWKSNPKHNETLKKIEHMLYEQAEEKLNRYQNLLLEHNISCSYSILKDSYLECIVDQNLFKETDLVIIGSHGASGKQEWFIGSNTQKVLRKINKNVLVIKDKIETVEFKKVVYATGLAANEKNDFKSFLKFISPFDIEEVHIVAVDTLSYFTQPTIVMQSALEDFAKIVTNHKVKTHFYKNYSVDAGVRKFVKEYNIDLVCISNTFKHPIKRIFNGSNVEVIVNHSHVPVLAIDN